MLVNDREEIDTGECRPSSPLCGYRLISPKVVVDSACIAQTFSYPFEGRSDSLRTFKRRDTHYLASQRGILYISIRFWGKPDSLVCVAPGRSSRDRNSRPRTFLKTKKGKWLFLGMNAGVSATEN